ncbi:GNAT family N-acetyltransferase [Gallaecimonas mangrovi]|uniref:GNAT family N-acetyltransferase n=1 Tax=Gallaecimonas mangrovi TaxID=2291597 RepID=UPI000E20040D|nr:GNAT family N-acetyltransferase [Gallaecimonas mangrovi]
MIDTPRLRLRRFTLDDVPAFFAMTSDRQVLRYTGEAGPVNSLAEAEQKLRAAPLADYERYGYGRLAVELKSSGEVIGFCGLKFLPEFNVPELGYRILPAFWGQGLITEAGKAVLEYGHTELGLARIIALIHPDNSRSVRVAEKLGMTAEKKVSYGANSVWCYQSEKN